MGKFNYQGILLYTLFIAGVFLMLLISCSKSEVNTTPHTWHSNKNIAFNPNLTYGELNDIDGNVYKTIQIGTQIWMAENLKTTKYNDGSLLPLITDEASWANLTTPAYCWYNNDSAAYKANYGALYNWYAVNTGKLAPKGWHVATDSDWTKLTTYMGGESIAGIKLKEAGTLHWKSPNDGATNESLFTALPGSTRNFDGSFDYPGIYGYWWTSTENYLYDAYYRSIYYNYNFVYRSYYSKEVGYSVRCVKD